MTASVADVAAAEPVPRGPGRQRIQVAAIAAIVVALVALAGSLLWPSAPGALVLHSGTPDHIVTLTVGSSRMGDSAVDIDLTDRAGNPVRQAVIRVAAIEPRMGYSDHPVTATATGPGRYHAAGVSFMMTGPWDLRLSITTGAVTDQLSVPLWIGG